MKVCDDDVNKYGNLGIKKDGLIKEVYAMKEKPSKEEKLSNYAIIGRYVLSPEIFDEIKKLKMRGNEIILTEALEVLATQGKLVASEFEGTRYDVGDKFGYVQANIEYALKNKALKEKVACLLDSLTK